MIAAIDIETNLAHDTIWCVSVVDTATHKLVGSARTPQELWPLICKYDTLVAHYGMGFDFPVLERVWEISLSAFKLLDTCVMGRLWYPDIPGGHSLAAWGERIGEPKMDFEVEDFDGGWTPEMQVYCEQDTVVLSRLYSYLDFQLSNDSFSQHSIDLEHSVNAITVKQVENGFLLDDAKTAKLWRDARRKQQHIDQQLQVKFPPITTKRISEKTGKPLKDKVEVFNVGSRQQIAKRLTTLGAKFTKFTEKGNVIVDEGALKEMTHISEAALCLDYLVQGKRASMLDGWLKAQQDDGRVHGSVNTCGAATRRMTHNKPNVAQADSAHDMRSCWTVPEGKVLLGVDASGLELRMLAHHINDPAFTAEVVDGDIHTRNMKAAGLTDRDQAKTFIYAYLYGAGDAKIGSIVGGSAAAGKRLKAQFLAATPGLKELRDSLKGQQMLTCIDGGRVRVRSEHAALNTLLQADGAVLMKQALLNWVDTAADGVLGYKLVANVHDEWQVEVDAIHADWLGNEMIRGIEDAGKLLCPNVPFTGEMKRGTTWAETH